MGGGADKRLLSKYTQDLCKHNCADKIQLVDPQVMRKMRSLLAVKEI